MIRAVAVVPTTPLLVPGGPGADHPDIVRIRAAVSRVLHDLPAGSPVLLLCGGAAEAVWTAVPSDLRGYGRPPAVWAPEPQEPPPLASPAALAAAEAAAAVMAVLPQPGAEGPPAAAEGPPGTAEGPTAAAAPAVGGDLRVMAALLAAAAPHAGPPIGLEIPHDLAIATAEAIADALATLAHGPDADMDLSVIAAGDLAAGHGPKPPRPHAAAASQPHDDRVIAALDGGRPSDLLRITPEHSREVDARAGGALRVLGALLERTRVGTVVRAAAAPVGVGYVVARGG